MREITLSFEKDDIVSWESLGCLSRHYKLDTMLRALYIPKVKVRWDDDSIEARKIARGWECVGRIDLYLLFHWLKHRAGVKSLLEVIVVDFEEDDMNPHSDKSIIECVKDLQVEIWDWRRMDISTDVIYDGAGKYVKTLYLYCSGLRAVLQSWSDRGGLVRLENVSLKTNQCN